MIRNIIGMLLFIGLMKGAGTVVVIQPVLSEQDYRSAEQFKAALVPYFDKIEMLVPEDEPKLIVLPEYLGAWLVAVGEPERVFRAPDVNTAMSRLVLHHPLRFIGRLFNSLALSDFKEPFSGHVRRSIFIMQAEKIREAYQETFSTLARDYRVWIVAGSVLLPEAEINAGEIAFVADRTGGKFNLMNQGFVFNPEGAVVLVSKKVYPVREELTFLDRGSLGELSVVETDMGRLGVLICADSWYPDCYRALDSLGVDIIAVPSFVNPAARWESPWRGYDPPASAPPDVLPEDTTGINPEKAMWKKYALCGRMGSTGAVLGINSFLVGSFWGLTGGGQSTIIRRGKVVAEAREYRREAVLYYPFR
ncbi:MAG: carbon-nitrogen hydrolase family protein [FCB group bacterium]|nr:carbon-nitrogen hydrolase family protein [FCB group bacterium]